MLKRVSTFIVLAALSILFTSCQSVAKEELDDSEYQRAVAAIEQLSLDMLSSLSVEISIEDLDDALPNSYKQYEAYVPLYSNYRDGYLEGVASICELLLPSLYDRVYQEMLDLSKTPLPFLVDDTSFTLALYSNIRTALLHDMLALLRANANELSECFKASKDEFTAISRAYSNLSAVGESRILTPPDEISLFVVASIAIDSLFDSLAERETFLKNQVSTRNSDSVYSIFWEER